MENHASTGIAPSRRTMSVAGWLLAVILVCVAVTVTGVFVVRPARLGLDPVEGLDSLPPQTRAATFVFLSVYLVAVVAIAALLRLRAIRAPGISVVHAVALVMLAASAALLLAYPFAMTYTLGLFAQGAEPPPTVLDSAVGWVMFAGFPLALTSAVMLRSDRRRAPDGGEDRRIVSADPEESLRLIVSDARQRLSDLTGRVWGATLTREAGYGEEDGLMARFQDPDRTCHLTLFCPGAFTWYLEWGLQGQRGGIVEEWFVQKGNLTVTTDVLVALGSQDYKIHDRRIRLRSGSRLLEFRVGAPLP